jgi:hypothetical protein
MMTKTQRDVASFLVRFTQDLWQDEEGEPRVEWRGHVRHVQGDDEIRFTDFAEAMAFMQRNMKELTRGTLEALASSEDDEQPSALRDGLGLWEQAATSYAAMMFGAMEQTMARSQALKQRMDSAMRESLQSLTPGSRSEPEQILEALQALQAQIQVLAARVGGLEDALKG